MLRRFDVFAVYNFVKNVNRGMPIPRAKGDALWLAKHVAGGRRLKVGGGALENKPSPAVEAAKHCACKKAAPKGEMIPGLFAWKELSGIPQTDAMYDREIIRRLGQKFYEETFLPRIQNAIAKKQKYEEIRDSLREELEPMATLQNYQAFLASEDAPVSLKIRVDGEEA